MSSPLGRRIGVIADTHGLLRPEAVRALEGCELILHAGDVGRPEVLDGLRKIAAVIAVGGNVDGGDWARGLPETDVVEVEGVFLYLLHDLATLDLDPGGAGFAAVISGHSHRAVLESRGGVLYLNPGSAGPRRFGLPVTLAQLRVTNGAVQAELIELPV
jgi:putative phosphoesterase